MVKIPSIDVDSGDDEGGREGSLPPDYALPLLPRNREPDTGSLRSHISENSFKTASSEPQLNLVPRQGGQTHTYVENNRIFKKLLYCLMWRKKYCRTVKCGKLDF